jgi:hypothetical protein
MGLSVSYPRLLRIFRLGIPFFSAIYIAFNPIISDTTWSRMRGNAWASVDNVNDWMEEMAEFSTIEELEEVLDAMTWMFQSQFGLGDGDMEAFIAPLRITLCLKQIMESYERAKSTGD